MFTPIQRSALTNELAISAEQPWKVDMAIGLKNGHFEVV